MYIVKNGQSIYDLSLLFGYGIEGAVQFAKDIGIENLNKIDLTGFVIQVTPKDNKLSNYLNLYATGIATFVNVNNMNNYLTNDNGDFLTTDDNQIIIVE